MYVCVICIRVVIKVSTSKICSDHYQGLDPKSEKIDILLKLFHIHTLLNSLSYSWSKSMLCRIFAIKKIQFFQTQVATPIFFILFFLILKLFVDVDIFKDHPNMYVSM